jgi:glycosyltransferase involved in cell wall biosynthesis
MKIVYVIDSHPENGGAPISACSIASEFAKTSNSVVLVLPKQKKEFNLDNRIRKIEIDGFDGTFPSLVFNPFKTIRFAYLLLMEIRKLMPDIIHVQMPRSAWALGILKIFGLLPKTIKYIYTDRDHMELYRWPFRLLCILLIKLQFNEVVCLTDISKRYWDKQVGQAKTCVIPNTAGEKYEYYEEYMHRQMRSKYGININSFCVMFCGRMSVYKNWGLAKDIVCNLKSDDIFFVFAISTNNEKQEKEFEQFKVELKASCAKYLMFHNVSQDDMTNYYYMADIFVLTSNKESFGRTAIEAMSRKCVVIGRNTGGLPEVIGKKENILECDVEEFCNRIRYYRNNTDVLNADREWFFERFNLKYTLSANTISHESIYEDVRQSESISGITTGNLNNK